MENKILLDPTGEHRPASRLQTARPKSLEGMTIGLLDIGKARGDVFLDRLASRLGDHGLTVKRYAKPTPSRLVATDTKQKMTSEVDLAIIGLAD